MDALKNSIWSLQNVALWFSGVRQGKQGIQSKDHCLKLTTLLLLWGQEEKLGVRGERAQLSFSFNAWTGDTFGEAHGEMYLHQGCIDE